VVLFPLILVYGSSSPSASAEECIRCFVRIDRSESGLLQFHIQCRNILLPDFRPARDEFLESFFEFLEYDSGLRRGCGIGAVRNRQDPPKCWFKLEKFSGCFARAASRRNCSARPFHSAVLLVESRDRIRKSALPCFRGAFLQLCAHRLNLRECFETFIHSFDGTALHFKLFAKIRKRSFDARVHLRDNS